MSLARDVTTVGSATLLSRLFGFFRDMSIAALLGAGPPSDAFFAVLQITNFFRRLLAEGALNAAFVPIWLRIKQDEGASAGHRFFNEVFSATTLTVGALALTGLVLASPVIDMLAPGFGGQRHALASDYLHTAAPYVALAGMVAVGAAVLNGEGRVVAVALGVVSFNAVLLLVLAWIAVSGTRDPSAIGAVLAHGIVLAGLAQLVVTAIGFFRLRPLPMRLRLGLSADTRRFFALAIPGLVAAGIPQLKLIAGAMIASSSQAAVSWLYYANRLYELPLGVVSIAIAAVLVPRIAASVRAETRDGSAAAQSRGFEITMGLALPSAVAFAVLAEPIARGLFERGAFGPRDTAAVAAALAAICAGLPGHTLEKLFGAISFAHEDTRTPMLAALAGLAAAAAGSFALFPDYGHVGVAAAIAVSGWVGATILGVILWRRGWVVLDRAAARRLPRIVAATLAMGLVIFAARKLMASLPLDESSQLIRLAILTALVMLGLGAYLAAIEALGVVRMRELVAAVRERL